MVPSKRRDTFPRLLVQGLVLTLFLSTTHSQWLSYRNPKSNLWFPNMPAPRTLQQRSSIGNTIRGSSTNSHSSSNSNSNNNNNPPQSQGQRSRPLNHRSVGQASYQTVHGGVISKQESLNVQPRTNYQSSSLLSQQNSPQSRQLENSGQTRPYASSSRLLNSQQQSSSNRQQEQREREHSYQREQNHNQRPQNSHNNKNSQFSQRSGQQQSWMTQERSSNNRQQNPSSPTVVTSKHLSINLNNPSKSKSNWQSSIDVQIPNGYTSSRRLLEVGQNSNPTRRPISQIAGALQDSWPNSNTHHHLQPMAKNQKVTSRPNNYYETIHEQGSPWGSQVRVSDQPIEIKNLVKSQSKSSSQEPAFADNPVDRQLAIGGRDKLVSNTLNTLAKLSPKKPIYVYMRAEGIAAVSAGADAGEVIKKLAGSSKLPFYNGTRSLPKENMPTVFLAPEDMTPPGGYGKIPIPNLKQKETTPKPTFTKILLPGGTRMTSHLSSPPPPTTTTTPTPIRFSTSQATAQSFLQQQFSTQQNNNTRGPISTDGLSLEQKLKILQMLKGQAEDALNKEGASSNQNGRYQFVQGPPPASETADGYRDMFRGVLPQGAILDSITTLGGGGQGQGTQENLNAFSQYAVPDQASNSLASGPQNPGPSVLPNLQGSVGETDIQKLIGAIVETAVSQTVGQMMPTIQQQQGQQQQQQQNPNQPPQFHPGHPQFPPQHQQQQFQGQFHQHQQQNLPPNFQQQQQHNGQLPMINGHPMHVVQNPISFAESKMGNGQTMFVTSSPPPPPQRPRPPSPPPSPKPPRMNPFKNALSLFGIQSTPRPGHGGRTSAPTMGPSTPRPFSMFNKNGPGPHNNGPTSPTRGPPPPHHPGHRPPPHHNGFGGSHESHSHEVDNNKKKGQTIIVQTPDRSKPNGAKSTFVITGGDAGNIPELNKIMKVLNELNGDPTNTNAPNNNGQLPQLQAQPSRPPPQFMTPTPPPIQFMSPTPTPQQNPTMGPTTMFPFNIGRPGNLQQQPQVMIRHPSGSPTPGPIVISTGRPNNLNNNNIQFVSSTFQPNANNNNGPTTPRPMFVSSTGSPIMNLIGPSPSSPSQVQIIKAIQMQPQNPNLQVVQPSSQPQLQVQFQPSTKPPTQMPQFIFATNPSPTPTQQAKTVTITQNQNKNINQAQILSTASSSPSDSPRIIEVDPSATKEEIHNSIMQSIMKHQQSMGNALGSTSGPIVIKTLIEGESPFNLSTAQIINAENTSKNTPQKSSGTFTVQPAIEITPAETQKENNKIPTKSSESTSKSNEKSSRNKKPSSSSSSEEGSRQQHYSKETSEVTSRPSTNTNNNRISSVEMIRTYGSKEHHHHSKEVSDEKPHRNNKYSNEKTHKKDQSNEKNTKEQQSSEEKVIEKVITEEKIVWNPGPSEGEMIPSRIKTEERIILRPHGSKSSETSMKNNNNEENNNNRRMSDSDVIHISSAEHNLLKSENERKQSSETDRYFQNPFGLMLVNRGNKNQETTDEEQESKFEDKSANPPSNFAGLLRSKLKFEKMKQRLYPTKPNKNPFQAPVKNNPFSQYLNPSPSPTAPSSTSAVTFSTSANTQATLIESTQQSSDGTNGRFKIRPGDISINSPQPPQGPVFGISPSGQPFILQPTAPSFSASPSPSAYPYGPSPSPTSFGITGSPTGFGPTGSPTAGSYIGPSPSSYPYIQQSNNNVNPSPSVPFLGVKVNPQQQQHGIDMSTIPPGTKDERLMFLPVDNSGKQIAPAPTIQTKNNQNQTVVFTTMNNLPDLMAQLSGTKTEVRMIDDMKTWQATLARVQATQATSTMPPPPMAATPGTTPQQSTTPTPTQPGNRRMDGTLEQDDRPMTWRPNGTVPVPTMESLRKRFPTGLGENILHAVSAGFSANPQIKAQWAQNGNNVNGNIQQQQPQVIYTMANGVPVAINTGIVGTNYQPYLIQSQGTKEPVMAYYGYNWNPEQIQHQQQVPLINPVSKSADIIEPAQLPAEPKYTSRFRGSAPNSESPESEIPPTKGPVFKIRKHKPTTTTRDPIDPLSEEYDDVAEEAIPFKVADKHIKKNKKGQSNEYEEPSKSSSSRRRRPGVLRDEEEEESDKKSSKKNKDNEDNSSEEENNKKTSKSNKPKPTSATSTSTTITSDSVVPDALAHRIDESDEEFESQDKKKPLKVHKDMFVVSSERETTLKQSQEQIQPTAKLPILLAPSIISSKSVVKKTGSNYSEKSPPKPKPTTTNEPSSSTTSKLLTTLLSKLSTTTKVTPTAVSPSKASNKEDDDDFRETQAELKNLLKKIQEKLSVKGDAYDLGDEAIYDYYEELQVPSTKATTTTTTKGTKKPKTKHSKSKPKSKKSKKSKKHSKKSKSKKSKKNSKKSKNSSTKSKKTTKKPKTTIATTTTTKQTTTTTSEPIQTSPTVITTLEITSPSTKLPQIFNHHRHPVSSLESFTSTSQSSTTTTTTEKSTPPPVNPTSTEEPSRESSSIEPQSQYQQQTQAGSVEVPTNTNPSPTPISFVYPQTANNQNQHLKDTTAARIHYRKRPLWVRRKGTSGSTESLEPLSQPSGSNGNQKVIRLVRRRRPGVRRRPVFVQQSIEVEQTSSNAPVPTEETSTVQSSTTSFPTIDSLFENNNELSKRVGYPDSNEGSQRAQNLTSHRIGGKRKLKLIRLKGQRAQWRLKMNEQDSSAGDEIEPQAALLVSPTTNSQPVPLASPLAVNAEAQVPSEAERQSRQEASMNSNSVEAKVCIQGKCGMISKQ